MNDYIAALLFFLPAGLANMTPPIVNKIPGINKWKTPLDLGKTWRGKRLLGDNKTWRGLITATIVGGITAVVVSKLNINTVVTVPPFIMGCLLGFSALVGDAAESFIKRQKGFKPGQSWFPFDQIDYIVSGLLIAKLFVPLPLWAIIINLVAYFGLHIVATYVGYLLKIRDQPI
ncbi:MAG TPA: CDP-archaeol synthase [Candidatus Limnocylindrales bacterium]|nr:CDP-archaeol synthase [Candidatus Limnocylindrales bacterium]